MPLRLFLGITFISPFVLAEIHRANHDVKSSHFSDGMFEQFRSYLPKIKVGWAGTMGGGENIKLQQKYFSNSAFAT